MELNGQAHKIKTRFRMEISVGITIRTKPEKVWNLLTDAQGFPSWNTTVKSVDGNIALGETIQLVATIAPTRTFKLKITTFEPNRVLVWQDGRAPMFSGVRRYTLTPASNDSTDFTMTETFAGLMLPMIAGSLPDFSPSFEQYAADLKAAAERS